MQHLGSHFRIRGQSEGGGAFGSGQAADPSDYSIALVAASSKGTSECPITARIGTDVWLGGGSQGPNLSATADPPEARPRPDFDVRARTGLIEQAALVAYKPLQSLDMVQRSLQDKGHRQSGSAKPPEWECFAARSSSPRACRTSRR